MSRSAWIEQLATFVLGALPAALLLGAHFLRAGGLALTIASVALVVLVFVPHPVARIVSRICLLAGAAEWTWTTWNIAQARADQGEPYTRMAIILGAVIVFTALSAWLLPSATPAGPKEAAPRES